MKVNKNEVQGNGKTIQYTHIEVGSKTICFMFSGGAYNYDRPLFYYSRMLMLQNKIDIVRIDYSYGQEIFEYPLDEITSIVMDDVNPVLNAILENSQYNDIIFLGKSLGTIPIANDLMKREEFLKSKMILLTPLLRFEKLFDSIATSQHEGLLVIGDRDHHYNSNRVKELGKSNLKIEVVQNADHSLEIGEFETINSIYSLSRVMEKLQEVIG